jgi:hypothetical protein
VDRGEGAGVEGAGFCILWSPQGDLQDLQPLTEVQEVGEARMLSLLEPYEESVEQLKQMDSFCVFERQVRSSA